MIIRENTIEIDDLITNSVLEMYGNKEIFKDALFFDLEHYIYKKPVCIGVFGCCFYDKNTKKLNITQYMIENKKEVAELLFMAENYFKKMFFDHGKKYIVTFSGNNDFTVINYLFKKHGIMFDFDDFFISVDLQKVYEKASGVCTGLKTLEKIFDIIRDNEPISGSNIAKTFSKVVKDDDYIVRMPREKINKILLYNEQDVINLFHIFVNWNSYIISEEEKKTISAELT